MSEGQVVYRLADLRKWCEGSRRLEPPARLAVIGDPVAHSRSPQMHNPALRAAGFEGEYVRVHLSPAELGEGIEAMREAGFVGFNATVPHKTQLFAALDEASETARLVGAANTAAFREGRLVGHNTDAAGFGRAVEEAFGVSLGDLRVMVVGAGGGAGRAAAVQCALEGSPRLLLVNRTVEKAQDLAKELAPLFPDGDRLGALPWTPEAMAREVDAVDLIVNASSVGMGKDDPVVIPASLLRDSHRVYDLVYSPPRTRLLEDAAAAGAPAANGEEMLLWQGAMAFEFWFGGEAPVAVMRAGLAG